MVTIGEQTDKVHYEHLQWPFMKTHKHTQKLQTTDKLKTVHIRQTVSTSDKDYKLQTMD